MNETIKQLRIQKGLNHYQLGKLCDIQSHQIKLYEEGKKDFSTKNFIRLADALGMEMILVQKDAM